jgi:endonuclease G, mitochondrial
LKEAPTPTAQDLSAALADVEAARSRPYYDEAADREAAELYFEEIESSDGSALRRSLADLLARTHARRPPYKPMRLVYPWVDLHPDGALRSIYSGKTFSPEELVRADARVETARAQRFEELVRSETALGLSALEAELDALEAALPYNCEHVVPQSWFEKREPMRGDLHHLFACESGCNSFRGNFPYYDFADPEEIVRQECGRRDASGFEPAAGKGPVARATLYFLLRYPQLVGDAERELRPKRLELLLRWHEQDPVSDYERHRNFAAAEIQGNRNPLIDNPGWAHKIDFTDAWGTRPVVA